MKKTFKMNGFQTFFPTQNPSPCNSPWNPNISNKCKHSYSGTLSPLCLPQGFLRHL